MDKLLATFKHAYATDENQVSKKLRAVLKMTEAEQLINDLRASYDMIVHADLDRVLDAMKVAYRVRSEVWNLRSSS